jgi:hypothetical protein
VRLALASILCSSIALAQPSPAPSPTEVREAIEALHHVENRLQALEREMGRLGALRASDPEVRQAIDELRAQTRSLEQRLASSQARVAELEASTPAGRIGYDEGLYFRASPVEVTLNGVAQPRYTGAVRTGGPNLSSVDLHHAQLQLRAQIGDWLATSLMLDFGSLFLGTSILRDAFADLTPTSWLRLRVGQFKVPFSRQQLVPEVRQSFVERALATRAFTFDRDLGAMVEGWFWGGRLLAQFAVTDGVRAGAAVANDNLDLAYTARLSASPLGPLLLVEGDRVRSRWPRFAIGIAVHYDLMPIVPAVDLDRNGRPDNLAVLSLAVEAAVRWHGFAVESEYFYRREDAGAGRLALDRHGGFVQATAMIWAGLYAGARYSYAQLPFLGPPPLGVLGDRPSAALEASGVVGYFLWGERSKAQLGYSYREDAPDGSRVGATAHIVELQLQAGF